MGYQFLEELSDKVDFGEMDDRFFLIGVLNEFMNRFQTVGDRFFGEISWKQCFTLICIGFFKEPPVLKELSQMMGSSHQNVKLWVGETFWKIIAKRMIVDMRDEIATGSSPFRPEGERFINDRTIYVLDGMGQKHFYYQSGKLIIWLAADENIAEQALYEVLEYFP